jgi:hypothetical protein
VGGEGEARTGRKLNSEFTDSRSYSCSCGGGWEELKGEVKGAVFAEDKAGVLFGDIEGADI